MKNPEGAAFLDLVMKKVGADNPTDLSKMLGEPWTSRDQQRRLYKWAGGESAPNFQGTIALLRLAGMLNEHDGQLPVRAQGGPVEVRLAAVEKGLDELVALIRDEVVAQLGESEARPTAPKKSRPTRAGRK